MAEFCVAGYGMGPFAIEVYEGGGTCLEDGGQGGVPPGSNVEDFDETRGRLGCGEPSAFITARCGFGIACVLENITQLQWDRRLDDISEASVTIDLSGDSTSTCCLCLADVEPWCHELHIWRDGEEVWVGPVVEITYSYSKVVVRARDSLAWLTVRVPPIDINFTAVDTDLTVIGEFIITTAFASDTVTCEVDNLHTTLTGFTGKRFWDKFSSDAFTMLADLSDTGLDFTTLGRTIVLVGDATPLTPLILLNDEHILGEVEITKNGDIQENTAYVHFDGDLGTPASSAPVNEFCYGPIERLHDGVGLTDGVSAGQAADIYVAAASIAPRIMEVPPGSRLSPDTPWTIDQMVCGARVDVSILKTCFTLTQSFRLTQVEVVYTPTTQEQVNITISPVNNPAQEMASTPQVNQRLQIRDSALRARAPRGQLGYAQVVADQSGITAEIDLTSLTTTVNIAAGRRIRIVGAGKFASTIAGDRFVVSIKEATTYLRDGVYDNESRGNNTVLSFEGSVILTPSAGTHTYKLTARRISGTGSGTLGAASTAPAYILVEDIGAA